MIHNKNYVLYICNDCHIDFIAFKRHLQKRTYCTNCGDHYAVRKVRNINVNKIYKTYHKNWTQEEIDIAMYGNKKGLTYKEIALELEGRTPKAIKHKVNEIKNMEKNK